MKGIRKLHVPAKTVTPKLFSLKLKRNDSYHQFKKVAYSLEDAIKKCSLNMEYFTIHSYVSHQEFTVDEINSMFKNFTP